MPFPWLPGMRMTASRMNARNVQLIEQAQDQTRTSSTTMVASEITLTPEVNAIYAYELYISYSADTASDFKWNWNAPQATFSSFTQARHPDTAGGVNAGALVIFRRPGNTTDRIAGGGGAENFHSAYDVGTFTTTGVAAPITMQFGQYSSNAGQTILRGSNQTRMLYQRIA